MQIAWWPLCYRCSHHIIIMLSHTRPLPADGDDWRPRWWEREAAGAGGDSDTMLRPALRHSPGCQAPMSGGGKQNMSQPAKYKQSRPLQPLTINTGPLVSSDQTSDCVEHLVSRPHVAPYLMIASIYLMAQIYLFDHSRTYASRKCMSCFK